MPSCGYIKKKAGRVCSGDMDKLVPFYDRDTVPTDDSITIDIKPKFSAWCMIETRRGSSHWDGTNTNREPDTTVFWTRAGYKFEKKMLALWNGKYFEVDRDEDINEDGEFLEITAVETGFTVDTNGDTNETSWVRGE